MIGPDPHPGLRQCAAEGQIELLPRPYASGDLDGARLIIAATDDAGVNRTVAAEAKARGIPVNVVDDVAAGDVAVPSIVDRSPVIIAVGTGGASPVLARQIRARLETLIPAAYGRLATLAGKFREHVAAKIIDPARRRHFWERVLSGPIAERVFAGHDAEAEAELNLAIDRTAGEGPETGEVYLVGGGPGDPDLLTFKAFRLMQQADVVLYDRLVAPAVLDMVRRDAERIYVGKARSDHAMRQEQINATLVRLAREGKRVLRLKGGDPFIFGRGGEEIDTLAREGIPFQVVPGITAASGCAAYAGIPLTHRDYAQSCSFVTGHRKDGSIELNWPMLAQPDQTVVFYMGLVGIAEIARQLIAHGAPADLPAALVEQGTTPAQRVHVATLGTLERVIEQTRPQPPTLLIVGRVVELRDKLDWYRAPATAGAAFLSRDAAASTAE